MNPKLNRRMTEFIDELEASDDLGVIVLGGNDS